MTSEYVNLTIWGRQVDTDKHTREGHDVSPAQQLAAYLDEVFGSEHGFAAMAMSHPPEASEGTVLRVAQ